MSDATLANVLAAAPLCPTCHRHMKPCSRTRAGFLAAYECEVCEPREGIPYAVGELVSRYEKEQKPCGQ